MGSGGHSRSGPAPDPLSRTSLVKGREFIELPLEHSTPVPEFPLRDASDEELSTWAELWSKPQAAMWDRLGLVSQVALYARSFVRASDPDGAVSLLLPVTRMATDLGITISGMLQNGWVIETPADDSSAAVAAPKGGAKRQTPTGSWLEGVKVETA